MPSDLVTLQAVMRIAAPGGPEVLLPAKEPVPQPRDGEILIAVRAAGVNRHDRNQRRRGPSPDHSDVPGLEAAGEVVATGHGVAPGLLGQRVCAMTDGGGYAPFAIAQAAHALPIPDGLGWVEAAALPEAGFTVWHNFFRVARLGAGESVLLHGGTRGLGTRAIQLLSALDHPVYATCGSAEKVAGRDGRAAARSGLPPNRGAACAARRAPCVLPLTEAAEAHRIMEAGAHIGKLVLVTAAASDAARGP